MYEIFERILEEKGLRAADVSRATGIKAPVFSEWKKGKSRPNTEKLLKIARFLEVSVEYLATGKDNETHYLNSEIADVTQKILDNKELRILFDSAKDAAPEDLETVHHLLLALKRKERKECGDID